MVLEPGQSAANFVLPTCSGQSFCLNTLLTKEKAVVLSFFKVSCPVCQFTFPYLERLHHSYPSIPILGISQDDVESSSAFARMYGLSFPILLDEKLASTVNYGLSNVPSLFLVNKNAQIALTSVGFVKAELVELNTRVAELAELPAQPLFTQADAVPDFKPG